MIASKCNKKQIIFLVLRHFKFSDPKVVIIDEEGSALQDKYYEVDSTLQLSCIVRNVKMTSSAVYWSHGERILNYDVERGGIRYVKLFFPFYFHLGITITKC